MSFSSYKYINVTKTFRHSVPFASIICVMLNKFASLLKYLVLSSLYIARYTPSYKS